MNESTEQPLEPNAFASPDAEDNIRRLAADDPRGTQMTQAVGLVLWTGWLMVVLVAVVWLVG